MVVHTANTESKVTISIEMQKQVCRVMYLPAKKIGCTMETKMSVAASCMRQLPSSVIL